MKKKAFTLIELLVVIAIIAILAAILFPVFAKARDRASAVSCLSNSNQIGKALMMYVDDHDGTYPANRFSTYPYTWKRALSTYVKSKDVWSCPSNKAVMAAGARGPGLSLSQKIGEESNAREQSILRDTSKATWLPSGHSYNGGFFHEEFGIRRQTQIREPSNLMVILESRTANPDLGPWTFAWRTDRTGTNPPADAGTSGPVGVFHTHSKRMNVTFADGHSQGVTLPEVYQKNMWGTPQSNRFYADVVRGQNRDSWPAPLQKEYW